MLKIILNFLFGVGIIGVGMTFLVKTEGWLSAFGRIELFERYLATSGGSRLGYKLLGIIVIFLGILTAFGLVSGFFGWVLSPLMNLSQPNSTGF